VDWYAQHDFRQIKIYNSFHPSGCRRPRLRSPARHARERTRAGVHALEEAIRAGYDEIQHINQLMLTFVVGRRTTRARWRASICSPTTCTRSTCPLSGVTDLVELMKQHGTVLDTTLTAFESSFTQKQGEISPSYAAVAVTFRGRCNAPGIRTR